MAQLTYDREGVLAPESSRSYVMYHAKITPTGKYYFEINDYVDGARLKGDLTNSEERTNAIYELRNLAAAANQMAWFIENHYEKEIKSEGGVENFYERLNTYKK